MKAMSEGLNDSISSYRSLMRLSFILSHFHQIIIYEGNVDFLMHDIHYDRLMSDIRTITYKMLQMHPDQKPLKPRKLLKFCGRDKDPATQIKRASPAALASSESITLFCTTAKIQIKYKGLLRNARLL